uniref:Reverse transcriptase domain-containing protein n=1 Tax=Haemonchus placei TaxID=6290 RepID=A0A0N4WGI2_HAEPC
LTVRVGTSFSESYTCTSGVPQGGVLSPLLFLIYTIELPELLKTGSDIHVQIYADDIKIYAAYEDASTSSAQQALRLSVERMNEWASSWDIPLNLNKCSVMHFGNATAIDYVINGIHLPSARSTKDLGVIFDTSLKFSSHIDSVVKKALATLFLVMRNTRCSDLSIVLRLYKAYVLPHLEYCSQLWSPYLKKDFRRFERVQHVFTLMLWYRSKSTATIPPYRVRLKLLSLHSLQYRRVMTDLVFCFRVLRKELTLSASKYWTFRPTSERLGGFNLH